MRVSILIYEGVEPIDLATFGVLSMARRIAPQLAEPIVIAAKAGLVTLANGLKVHAEYAYADAPSADVMIVLGGPGWQQASHDDTTLEFIRQYGRATTLASVCTGAMLLAAAGVLDGRSATTKHEVSGAEISPLVLLGERYPGVSVRHARLVDTGAVLTGGGVSLCIDLTLYLLERYLGLEVARETARIMEYSAAFDANKARLPALLESAQGQ